MSAIKSHQTHFIDSEEDENVYTAPYSHFNSKSIQSSRIKSPSKQPWKPASRGNSLANSQVLNNGSVISVTRKVLKKPKFTMPSQSCAREKQELKHQICHLEEGIRQKNLRMKQLRADLNAEQQNREQTVEALQSQQEWKQIAEEQRYENQNLKENEIRLYNEVQEQQILCKEALSKLYEYREEQLEEKEKLREMYEQYAEDRVQEERIKNMDQINNLLDLNDKLKVQVTHVEQQMEALRNQEVLMSQVQKYKSAIAQKKQLQQFEQKQEEILRSQKLRQDLYHRDVEELKLQCLEKERNLLERDLDYAQRQKFLKSQIDLDQSRRMVDIELENEQLRREREYRSNVLRSADLQSSFRKNESYNQLQSQLSNMKYDLEDIKHENKKILHTLSPQKKR